MKKGFKGQVETNRSVVLVRLSNGEHTCLVFADERTDDIARSVEQHFPGCDINDIRMNRLGRSSDYVRGQQDATIYYAPSLEGQLEAA